MKQLIILLLLIILGIIGYGQYATYKRYHTANAAYKTSTAIDLEYHNQSTLADYFNAIENLNSFVTMQWTANEIDVRTPDDTSEETKIAVANYAKKLANIKYLEQKLLKSTELKKTGYTNKEIKFLEEKGISNSENSVIEKEKSYSKTLRLMFEKNENKYLLKNNAFIFEIQKLLVKKGHTIQIDGLYKTETANAIKSFEVTNNLFADGIIDLLTLEALLK